MPQMSPLMWVSLMSLFLVFYTMNTVKMYFLNTNLMNNSTETKKMNLNRLSWKW